MRTIRDDNSASITIPKHNVYDDKLYPDVIQWLYTHVTIPGGWWHWTDGLNKKDIPYLIFFFSDVKNSVRLNFANKYCGFVKFVKPKLFIRNKSNSFDITVPSKNVTFILNRNVTSYRYPENKLYEEVREWLEINVLSQGGDWDWEDAGVHQDIQHVTFILSNVPEDIALLFKITYG